MTRAMNGGVMPARDLVMIKTRKQLFNAATTRERVRVQGKVVELGDGYSGTYRNVWLRIETRAGNVRVTASPNSTLGTMPAGSNVELAATMTGLVNVAENVYYGERTQLLHWTPAAALADA
jgi:hypothetical protein